MRHPAPYVVFGLCALFFWSVALYLQSAEFMAVGLFFVAWAILALLSEDEAGADC